LCHKKYNIYFKKKVDFEISEMLSFIKKKYVLCDESLKIMQLLYTTILTTYNLQVFRGLQVKCPTLYMGF